MYKILMTLFAACMLQFSQAQTTHPANDGHDHGPANKDNAPELLKFKQTEHDFGQIPQGKPVYYTFELVNTTKGEIKLDNVQASCGCTTPEWSRDPIAAGATSKIRVGYNAANEGSFEKYITITYNGTVSKQIKIKGVVWKAPEGSAPANGAVDFLKKQNP